MPVWSTMNSRALLIPLWLALASTSLAQDNPGAPPSRLGQPSSAMIGAGRKSYEGRCATCHGLDGRGGEHAPGIANSRTVQGERDKVLAQFVRAGNPRAGMPAFSYLSENELMALVRYLRSLSGITKVEPVKGDPVRGERLFFAKAQCGDCHMLAGKGGFIATDLLDFAVAHSPEEIRAAIVRPNEKLLPGQEVISVETAAGERLTGVARNEDNFSLQLQGTDGEFHLLMKSQIAKLERTGRSLMPADYGTRLSSAELDDLVSYIALSARRVEAPPGPSGDRTREGRRSRP